MATLVWFSGCECGPPDGSGFGKEFTSLSNGGGGLPTIQSTTKRSGTYGLKLPVDGSARASAGTYSSNATTYFRGYFQIGANPTNAIIILSAGSSSSLSSSRFQLWLNTNGTLGWDYNTPAGSSGPAASGSDAVNLGAWNRIEIKYVRDASAGGMEIYLNGVLQVSSFATATTTGTSLTTMTLFFVNDAKVPGTGQSGQDMYWDDMAFGFGGYIGAGQCVAVQGKAGTPTYDAFTKNVGATADECWSETPWSGTKNCTSSTIAQRQTMLVNDTALNAAIGASDTINGAMVLAVTKIVTSGNCKLTRRIGGVDTDSATKILGTVDTLIPEGLDHTMDVFVDTRANLASAEIGVVANSTNLLTVEDVWLVVDFTPDPNPDITPGTGSLTLTGQLVTTQGAGSITPGTGALALVGSAPLTNRIAPGTGALGLTGYTVDMRRPAGGTGALSLVGQQPTLRTQEALTVLFDIITPTRSPLIVQFDIIEVPGTTPDPLTVEFDIIQANGDPLVVTFDILNGDLVNRRLTSDIQGPVAKAVIS